MVKGLSAPGSVEKRRDDANLIVAERKNDSQHATLAFRNRAKRAKDIRTFRVRFDGVRLIDGAIDLLALDAALGEHIRRVTS